MTLPRSLSTALLSLETLSARLHPASMNILAMRYFKEAEKLKSDLANRADSESQDDSPRQIHQPGNSEAAAGHESYVHKIKQGMYLLIGAANGGDPMANAQLGKKYL